ncbi:MAG TPA: hypothetical protein VH583_04820 [Vicinamibacterales bacterium]|jgi:Cu/Ag efflux protein CusF
MTMKNAILGLACVLAGATLANAQQPKPVTKMGEKVTATATIEAIDSTARRITFKNPDGTEDTVVAGPEVQRFNELKVGDKVTMTYYESTVYQVRKAGTNKMSTDSAALMPTGGKLPGGTMAVQTVRTVTVKAVDPKVPSITVVTEDGRTLSRKVEKKSYLDGVKPGDKIDITYTEAVLANVERPK